MVSKLRKGGVRKKPGCLVISILCGIGGFVFLAFIFPNCEADSKQARMAKSLSRERLANLHQEMAKLWSRFPKEDRNTARVYFREEQIPKELGGLGARFVRIGGGRSIIRLQGCYDHHLDLVFYGVGEPADYGDHSPRIEIHSGEHVWAKQETLWHPDSSGSKPESGK